MWVRVDATSPLTSPRGTKKGFSLGKEKERETNKVEIKQGRGAGRGISKREML